MCEFCVKHGDGRRWYLNAANYAAEMLADARRDKYIRDFIPQVNKYAMRWLRLMDVSRRIVPGLSGRIAARQSEKMKAIHYSQVIPLEDVEAVTGVVGQVLRLPCICRETLQKKQAAVCYLLAADPGKIGLADMLRSRPEGIPYADSLERVEPAQALAQMADLEDKGMIHTIWTFITPFIGAICNCDPSGCLAMNFTARGLRLYLPGDWKAEVDARSCTSCGSCREVCLFSAIVPDDGVFRVEVARCQGCGICRRSCPSSAISLRDDVVIK